MECHGVSAACIGNVVAEQSVAEVEESIQLTQRDGEVYARLTVTNVSGKDRVIGTRSWGFTCADDSREVLYFMFRDTPVLPNASLVSNQVIACFGKGSAIADGSASKVTAMSVAKMNFYCDSAKQQQVEVKILGERLVRFKRSDGLIGTHRLTKVDGSDLVTAACEYQGEQQIADWKQRRDQSKVVEKFVGNIISALGLTPEEFEQSHTAVTGVRN